MVAGHKVQKVNKLLPCFAEFIPCDNVNELCTNVTSILKEDKTKGGISWASVNVRQLDHEESFRVSCGVQKSVSVSQHITCHMMCGH